jgi:hypothetical protein
VSSLQDENMTDTETYWVAGLLEGEGVFGLYHVPKFQPRIKISLADEDVIRRYASLVAGKVKSNSGVVWHCEVTGLSAIRLMLRVAPLFGQRRRKKIRQIVIEWRKWAAARIEDFESKDREWVSSFLEMLYPHPVFDF